MTRTKGSKNRPKPINQELAIITPTPIAPVGRPKLPETVVKELEEKIRELNAERESANRSDQELKQLAELIRIIQRAVKGLSPDEDVFLGLINAKDIRERTRLNEAALLSHSAMRAASDVWPELSLMREFAEMEDPYYISEDGEGRREGILLQQAKSKLDANLILNMPNTQGGTAMTEQPQGQQPKKKGLLNKIKSFGR
jgi:hypothetical protein